MNIVGPLNSGEVSSCLDAASDQDSKSPVVGCVKAVYIKPNVGCLSAPTVTVTTKNEPVQTILAVSGVEEAGWYYPVTPVHLNTDGSVISGVYSEGIPVHDFVNVEISNANYGDDVDVYLMVE